VDRSTIDDEEEAATEGLVALLLDARGPVLQWYRDEVGRRLGLSSAEVLCEHARALADRAADQRLYAARWRAREADTRTPWWR
jgi:hypothetical protein